MSLTRHLGTVITVTRDGHAVQRIGATAIGIGPPPPQQARDMMLPTQRGGSGGTYTLADIKDLLRYFVASYEEVKARAHAQPVVLHTGYPKSGGGNKVLVTIAQLLAASLVGLDRVVLDTDAAALEAALAHIGRLADGEMTLAVALCDLFVTNYTWP